LKAELQQEIERRHQAETNLERYNHIFDILNEFAFFFYVDEGGLLVREWWTKAFEVISGFNTEEIDGRGGWFSLIYPGDREYAVELVQIAILRGGSKTSEIRIITKAGDVRWLRVVFFSIWDEAHQRVIQIYGTGQDVTQEKAVQAQQARFVTHAMHEFSHPVSSILMRLYLLRKQPERLDEHLDALQPPADHLRRMIEDMREYSSLEQGSISLQRRDITLQQLLHSVINAQEEKLETHDIRLSAQMPDEPLETFIDMDRIQQALSRLILNAINQTSPGHEISIQLSSEPADHPTHAVITLRHKGKPIEADQTSVMFLPFYRASEGTFNHTGLELTIAQEIIKLHGGSVDFKIDPDGVNVFIIKLTLIDKHRILPI